MKVPFRALLVVLLFLLYALFLARPTDLTRADIGRHIKNGEIFLSEGRLIRTNYYSYTQPEWPVVNHHWATGAVFYQLYNALGFPGLAMVYVGILVLAVGICFITAWREAGFEWAFVLAAACIPLIYGRTEIRPEGFSYLLMAVMSAILCGARAGRIRLGWLWLLPVLQLGWVNLHSYFLFGPFLAGCFWLEFAVIRGRRIETFRYGLVILAMALACLVNPFGWEGVTAPFTLSKLMSSKLSETQSLWLAMGKYHDPGFYHSAAISVLSGLVLAAAWWICPDRRRLIAATLVLVVFNLYAWKWIRGIAVFGYFLIPMTAVVLREMSGVLKGPTAQLVRQATAGVAAGLLVIGLTVRNSYYSPYINNGLARFNPVSGASPLWLVDTLRNARSLFGVMPDDPLRPARFFQEHQIQGPVFNNYDNGGYLIFALFPRERVFVDNRPEAYSPEFFRDWYDPMREDEKVWQEADRRYGFNAIFYQHIDQSYSTKPFLKRRLADPQWVPVYLDASSIILVRDIPQNAQLIQGFNLKQSAGEALF